MLLTGDNRTGAEAVTRDVGVLRAGTRSEDTVIAGVLPEDKAGEVRRLQAEGRTVAMVGDGVNDAAALASADPGLAMGTGTYAAIEAGELTLVRGDLRVAADAVFVVTNSCGCAGSSNGAAPSDLHSSTPLRTPSRCRPPVTRDRQK